ncbi:MAG: hypothetical protein JSU74_04655 [Candidatus Zixiibacteriota bacterium]|nr:MAG: hypothetical protein JSU74_04655 [candidate division Zixibacteria bacterium]
MSDSKLGMAASAAILVSIRNSSYRRFAVLGRIKGLIAVVTLLLTVIPTYAEVVPEVTFTGGYTDNLFNDSSSLDDTYTAVSPYLKIYPSATTEISLSGTYTSYFDHGDLSNLSGRAGLTIIPDLKNSDLHLMFSGGIGGRSYGDLYEVYNNWGGSLKALFSYAIKNGVMLRGGGSASFSEYTNSISGDNDGVGFLIGLNATPFGSNSVNIEAGYSFHRYVTEFEIVETGRGQNSMSSLEGIKNNFQMADFSIRYSRPLGDRTGLSATLSRRLFVEQADSVVYGFTVDYLSPWTSMWEGTSLSARVKHFPGLDFIVESGFAYTDKEYIQSLDVVILPDPEDPEAVIEDYVLNQRNDERMAVFVKLQRPFSTGSRLMVRPSLQIRWIDNQSTDLRYDYSYPDVQLGVIVRF